MMHLDEGALLALLDDETTPAEARNARAHLESCAECRAAYASLEEEAGIFAVAVAAVDREPHLLEARAAISRGRVAAAPRQSFMRAAALVLLAAGVASATVPGSPVRDWIRGVAPTPPPEDPAPLASDGAREAPVAEPETPREAGISILPSQGSVRVLLHEAGALTLRVRLTDGERVEARVFGRAADARFATAEGLIRVTGAAGGDMELAIPRSVQRASVELDGIILLYKEGDRLHVSSVHPTEEVRVVVVE